VIPLEIKFYDIFWSKFKSNISYNNFNNYILNDSKIKVIKEIHETTLDPMNTGFINFSDVDYNILVNEMDENRRVVEVKNNDITNILPMYIKNIHNAYTLATGHDSKEGFALKEGNHGLPYINQIKVDFSDAKFIVMVRDPRDCYASFKSISQSINSGNYYPSFNNTVHVMGFLFDMNNQGKTCYDFMKYFENTEADEYITFVKYEKLVSEPKNVMRNISEFLGIEFENGLIAPTIAGKHWGGNSSSRKQSKQISSTRVGNWKNVLENHEVLLIEYFLQDYLVKWGYDRVHTNTSFYKCLKSIKISDIADTFPVSWKDFLKPYYFVVIYLKKLIYYTFKLISER